MQLMVIQIQQMDGYAEQWIDKKKQEGTFKSKSVHAQWKEVSLQF
jgi:hypothetical protein